MLLENYEDAETTVGRKLKQLIRFFSIYFQEKIGYSKA